MTKSAELREQRAKLIADARILIDKADTEKRDLSADESQKWDAMQADADKMLAKIERMERQEEADASVAAVRSSPIGREGAAQVVNATANKSADELRADAFRAYLRSGEIRLSAAHREALECRDQSVGTPSEGGYLAPALFDLQVVSALKAFNGVRQAGVNVITTATGNDLPIATSDDTSNVGELQAENNAANSQSTVFGTATLKQYIFNSKQVPVSRSLLEDSAIDLNAFLGGMLGERIGRIEESYFTTGTGSGEPHGIVTGSGDSGVTSGAAGLIDSDDLLDLMHSVDPAYRADPSCGFMFNDTTLKILKKMKDEEDRPLWIPGIAMKEPDTIHGKPYWINQSMSGPTAGNKAILFGAMRYFMVRDVRGIEVMRLIERAAEKFQIIFLGFHRCDSRHTNSSAIKYLTMHSS